MGDTYKKLPAKALVTDQSRTVYNDTIDMLRWWKVQQARTGAGSQTGIVDWDQTLFPVKNNSGADLKASYGVLGLNGPLYSPDDSIDEFLNVTPLEGVAPTVADHAGGRWCVVLEPLKDGEVSRKACLSGVVPVRVYVNSVNDKFCDVSEGRADGDSTCYLATGNGGAQILWLDDNAVKDTVAWAIIRLGYTPQWARLVNDLHQCSTAEAVFLVADDNDLPCDAGDQITVSDPHGVVAASRLAVGEQSLYIPAGCHVFVSPVRGVSGWVAIAFGSGICCGASTSQSTSSSQSSSASSQSSGSQSDSRSGSESGSQSGSPSGSGPSGSGPSGSGSGSDKSTAIVPASWTPDGYTALFIAECPEVRFDDVMTVVVDKPDATFTIDGRFIEVCERGSIEVCGCVPDLPVLIGASVEPRRPNALEAVRIRIAGAEQWPVRVAIRLTGIRRGFAGHRFPNRTQNQFEANERFIRSAYPDEQ